MNFGDRHPERGSVMVNYEIAMIMLPMVLLGGMIGVQINYILPDAVILGLLTLLLIYMGWKVTNTGFKKWNEENAAKVLTQEMNPLKEVVDGSEDTEDGPVNASMEDEGEEQVKMVADQDETLASSTDHL